jgi:hypothetical protein
MTKLIVAFHNFAPKKAPTSESYDAGGGGASGVDNRSLAAATE